MSHGTHDSGHGGHAHPAWQAHHFDTPEQQFESGKLGMWLFLATEILMFGGLFAAYALYRSNHPEIYMYAHKMLDPFWGGVNTAILLGSSWTMAMAVRYAQLGNRRQLLVFLGLTILGGVGFFCVKAKEYTDKFSHGIYPMKWNIYYPLAKSEASFAYQGHPPARLNDEKYWAQFQMTPAMAQLKAIEHAESFKEGYAAYATHGAHGGAGHGEAHGEHKEAAHAPAPAAQVPLAVVPVVTRPVGQGGAVSDSAAAAPAGLAAGQTAEGADRAPGPKELLGMPDVATAHHDDRAFTKLPPEEQKRVHIFFNIYYAATGLHALHVAIGMAILIWLWFKAYAGHFSKEYNSPVDIGGLYWHLVDLIWIFLFPLLYLIH